MATDDNGLYYMRARYYNPEIRRFINQDIVTGSIENSQSLNRYAYCQGNPVNYFDPFGLEPCEFFTGLGHGMLNLMGLIPGIGDVFDITNAIWYALDGNWGRCFESGIAALPFIGNLLPDRRTCDYVRRVLNIASYGGTAVLAGQGMVDGGQALWADISSGQCSGWSIFLGVANIGLNGATLFFSGKSFVSETKDLNKMLKADGVYERVGQWFQRNDKEIYYRTMSQTDYDYLRMTGELHGTSETFISPTQSFSDNYHGITVKFEVNKGTTASLLQIGVSNNSGQAIKDYGFLPQVMKGWNENYAFFKGEGIQTNIGLGIGRGLEIFNSNIINFTVVGGN